jgi:hypothetical protein
MMRVGITWTRGGSAARNGGSDGASERKPPSEASCGREIGSSGMRSAWRRRMAPSRKSRGGCDDDVDPGGCDDDVELGGYDDDGDPGGCDDDGDPGGCDDDGDPGGCDDDGCPGGCDDDVTVRMAAAGTVSMRLSDRETAVGAFDGETVGGIAVAADTAVGAFDGDTVGRLGAVGAASAGGVIGTDCRSSLMVHSPARRASDGTRPDRRSGSHRRPAPPSNACP